MSRRFQFAAPAVRRNGSYSEKRPGPRFTLRTLLVLLLPVLCFVGGIQFERERQRRENARAEQAAFEADRIGLSKDMLELQIGLSQSNARMDKLARHTQSRLKELGKERERLKAGLPSNPVPRSGAQE
jgi:hypothetical protein